MKVIHTGTEIVSTMAVVDDDGNIVQNFTVRSDPKKPEDILRIKVLNVNNFVSAFNAIVATKHELQGKVDEEVNKKQKPQDTAKESNSTEPEPVVSAPEVPPVVQQSVRKKRK